MQTDNNVVPFLKLIKSQPKRQTTHTKPKLSLENIRGISLRDSVDYLFAWTTEEPGYSWYEVDELSSVELKAVEEFIQNRLTTPLPSPLSSLRPCDRSEVKAGTRVFTQYDSLSPKCLGRIEQYAYRKELGDSWLVRFTNKSAQYIPSSMIYRDTSNVLSIF